MAAALIEAVGVLAGLLTSTSFVPQVVKTLKTRDTAAISLGMYAAFTAGVAIWLVYGVLTGSISIMLTNAFTLLLAGAVLALKLRYR